MKWWERTDVQFIMLLGALASIITLLRLLKWSKLAPWARNDRRVLICVVIIAVVVMTIMILKKRQIRIRNTSTRRYYKTIQAAINEAEDGETILVSGKNRIRGAGNRDIDFKGKSITLQSKKGAKAAIIDCEKAGRGFCFFRGETKESVVRGFTITNSLPRNRAHSEDSKDGAIYCFESSPTIENNMVNDNQCSGIYCGSRSDEMRVSPIITNNEICRNSGAGIYCIRSAPKIINSTIVGNRGKGDKFQYGICTRVYSKPVIVNTIVWYNELGGINGGAEKCVCHSNVEGGDNDNGNINTPPLFVNRHDGDYHLAYNSPCRNAGTMRPDIVLKDINMSRENLDILHDTIPSKDIEGNDRPCKGKSNPSIGAYESK